MAIKGVTSSATREIRFTPPITTKAISPATATPIIQGAMSKVLANDMAMLLLCIGGRHMAHTSTVMAANNAASHLHFSPFSI